MQTSQEFSDILVLGDFSDILVLPEQKNLERLEKFLTFWYMNGFSSLVRYSAFSIRYCLYSKQYKLYGKL